MPYFTWNENVTQSCPTPVTSWTVPHQAPLSMGFSGQEYWSRVPLHVTISKNTQPQERVWLMSQPDSIIVGPAMQETWVQSRGQEDPLEKNMATHSSTLAWRIPRTEEPGGLQSMELQSRRQLSEWHTPGPRQALWEAGSSRSGLQAEMTLFIPLGGLSCWWILQLLSRHFATCEKPRTREGRVLSTKRKHLWLVLNLSAWKDPSRDVD